VAVSHHRRRYRGHAFQACCTTSFCHAAFKEEERPNNERSSNSGYYRVSPVLIRHPQGRGGRSLRYQEVGLLSSIVFQRWGTRGTYGVKIIQLTCNPTSNLTARSYTWECADLFRRGAAIHTNISTTIKQNATIEDTITAMVRFSAILSIMNRSVRTSEDVH
jgi:hypothetical protein